MNRLANNASCHPAQVRYDNAEDPRYSEDARDEAIEQEIEVCWSDSKALADTFSDLCLDLGRDACTLLFHHRAARMTRGRGEAGLTLDECRLVLDALVRAIEPQIEQDAERCIENHMGDV
jgi:hypothetical protein